MKKFCLFCAGIAVTAVASATGHAGMARINGEKPSLTVLESFEKTNDVKLQIIRDAKGRVYKQRVAPGESLRTLDSAVRVRKTASKGDRTFYEGFEGYMTSYGMNWIPEGWTKKNTPEHTPTDEQLAHNINNSWYVYYSSDLYQEMTSDGESEAFIHFGYEGQYGANSKAQDEWLISPEITLGDNETLSFLHQAEPFSTYDFDWDTWEFDRSRAVCDLYVMITDDGGANWSKIWGYEEDYVSGLTDDECDRLPMAYRSFDVSLARYAGKNVKIAFRYLRDDGNYIGNSMMVDGVEIYHPAGEWTLLGTGKMADGWVIPALTAAPGDFYNPQDYVFDVQIYESSATPGVYKLSSPYTSAAFPFLDLNANKMNPYDIIIDASNPEFVVVEPQISGFEHNNPGSKASRYAVPYYISNAGTYFLEEGNSIEDIIDYGYASTFDAEKGVITITTPQYGHMVGSTLDMGYSCSGMDDYPTVITLPQSAPAPEWEVLGKGVFVDGFIYSGFFGDPKGHGWEVDILTKSDAPGIYMMSNPYAVAGSPLYDFNLSATSNTMIKIDASRPNLVSVQPQFSGFTDYDNGAFYIGNMAGWYESFGYNLDQMYPYFEEDEIDTLENGVITFNFPLFGFDANDEFGYQWVDSDNNALVFPAKLYLPGSPEIPESPVVSAEQVLLNVENIEGVAGDTYTLTATVLPEETTDKTVVWTTSAPQIASVEDGIVKLVAEGRATITAACGSASATCSVLVKEMSGIMDFEINDVTIEYYTPLGVKVEGQPAPGLYIRRSNGTAETVIVK